MPAPVAFVVDTFPRWSERFIAREALALLGHGVDVRIFCLKAGRDEAADDPDFAPLLPRRVVLPSCVVPWGLYPFGDAPDMLRRQRRTREALGLTAYARLSCASVLGRLLREQGVRHVHAHFANLPSTLGWLAAASCGLPFTFSAHARDLFVEPQLLPEKIADATRCFACHAGGHARLSSLAGDKAVLMRHGLPLAQYPFRAPAVPDSGRPIRLLAAGRFVPKKGFPTLLEALARPGLATRFSLTLLGDGPLRRDLARQIERLGLSGTVHLNAPVDAAGLTAAMRAADLFVAPYETAADGDSDGVPNVLLEAFALGTPVLGTSAGGLGEVLDPSTGTVVPVQDPTALAAALTAFAETPSPALARTPTARARIERDFDLKQNIAPLVAAIQA